MTGTCFLSVLCACVLQLLADHSTETQAALALAHAAAGNSQLAAKMVADLEALQAQHYVLPYNIAKIHAAGDNQEKASNGWNEPMRKTIRT